MRFLLFDADYTLLDFPKDMTRSFTIMYEACFSSQRPYSPELLRRYEACNNRAWDRFERGSAQSMSSTSPALWSSSQRPASPGTRRL